MDRRTLLRTAASSAVSACLLGGMTVSALHAYGASLPTKPHISDFVEVADGAKLGFTDCGKGRPVVFVDARALPSPMCS
jgi:hypothetical protein